MYIKETDEFLPQAPIVVTYPVYDSCTEDMFAISRSRGDKTTLFGNGPFGPSLNIFAGDMLFCKTGAMRDSDQTPSVFTNLECIPISKTDDLSEKKRQIYQNIQFVGIATSAIKYDAEKSIAHPSTISVQTSGGCQIRHSGEFSVSKHGFCVWEVCNRVEGESQRAIASIRTLQPGNTGEIAKTFDFSDALNSEAFRKMAKLQMMLGIAIGREVEDAEMNVGAVLTPHRKDQLKRLLIATLEADGDNREHFGNQAQSNYLDQVLDVIIDDLKETDGILNVRQNRLMESIVPFAASVMSTVFSRFVSTSADYTARGLNYFGFLNGMAVRAFTDKFMF